jgi:hypothetical protein
MLRCLDRTADLLQGQNFRKKKTVILRETIGKKMKIPHDCGRIWIPFGAQSAASRLVVLFLQES